MAYSIAILSGNLRDKSAGKKGEIIGTLRPGIKWLFVMMSFCFCLYSNGQISVFFPVLPGQFSMQDFAQTTIINGSNKAMGMCYYDISCTSASGTKFFELKTQSQQLGMGSNIIGLSAIAGAQVIYSSPVYTAFEQQGALPVGDFNICVTVYHVGGAVLGTSCTSIHTVNTKSFYLLSPTDQQIIATFYPSFNWMTLDESNKDMSVTYDIKVCQLMPGQNYAEAIGQNTPVLYQQSLNTNSIMYPASAPQLDTAQKYVWQVEADVSGAGGELKLFTEIWMFQFAQHIPQTNSDSSSSNPKKHRKKQNDGPVQYAYLTKDQTGSVYLFEKKINFRYNNECNDKYLNYAVYERGKQDAVLSSGDNPVPIKARVNYISINVPREMMPAGKGKKGSPAKLYVLQVKNSRRETLRLKFTIVQNNEKKS